MGEFLIVTFYLIGVGWVAGSVAWLASKWIFKRYKFKEEPVVIVIAPKLDEKHIDIAM